MKEIGKSQQQEVQRTERRIVDRMAERMRSALPLRRVVSVRRVASEVACEPSEQREARGVRRLHFDAGFPRAVRNALIESRASARNRRVDKQWGLYNSTTSNYESHFVDVLAKKFAADVHAGRYVPTTETNARDIYSIARLLEGKTDPVVVDLMAPSGTLMDLFGQLPADPGRKGIALSLQDNRSRKERKMDTEMGITQMKGDLTHGNTWRSLTDELGGRKADLIMERSAGALGMLPYHEQYFRYAINRLWRENLSDNGGVLLLQGPPWDHMEVSQQEWGHVLDEHGIENYLSSGPFGSIVLLVKRPDSPAELPRA